MKKREKVIFCQNTPWGEKYERKELARGFAAYLFREGKVLFANKENLQKLEKELAQAEQKRLLSEQKARELYQKINNFTLNFTLKKNEKNEPLGSINFKEILQALEKNGFQIEKSQLVDFHPLHQLGENKVKIKLSSQLTVNLKIIII